MTFYSIRAGTIMTLQATATAAGLTDFFPTFATTALQHGIAMQKATKYCV